MDEFYQQCLDLIKDKQYNSAYDMCATGEKNAKDDKEKSKFTFQKSLAAWYSGRYYEHFTLCDDILRQKIVDESVRQQAQKNIIFGMPQLQSLKEIDLSNKIHLLDRFNINPSIVRHGNKMIINIENLNKSTTEESLHSRNFLFEADLEIKRIKFWKELIPIGQQTKKKSITGLQNVRLFSKDGKLYGIGTRFDSYQDNSVITIIDIETGNATWIEYCKDQPQSDWSPIKDRFIFTLKSYITFKISDSGQVYDQKIIFHLLKIILHFVNR